MQDNQTHAHTSRSELGRKHSTLTVTLRKAKGKEEKLTLLSSILSRLLDLCVS